MPQTHFPSMKATQNKSDVTNRFCDLDFLLAVCTYFLCNSDCFKVICDFRSLKNARIPFPVDGSTQNESDVSIGFGDRDFILTVCTCFLRKGGRFAVIRDFRSLNHGVIPLPVDRSTAERK
jgi:hypothetical protein